MAIIQDLASRCGKTWFVSGWPDVFVFICVQHQVNIAMKIFVEAHLQVGK